MYEILVELAQSFFYRTCSVSIYAVKFFVLDVAPAQWRTADSE